MNNLPNLLIVGAAKSGTTSLHNYLNQHPDIFMCSPKEPHFLINKEIGEERIPKGVLNIEDYQSLFDGNNDVLYRGESSVMYLLFSKIAINNIKKYLGEKVKIIIMLRNPVDRAYSGYQHVKRYNLMENLSFEEALKKSQERYDKNKNMTPASRYLELGMYHDQVKNFKQEFENVHVIFYDDYKNQFEQEIKKVFSFLDLKSIEINTDKKHMVGGWEWNNNLIKRIMLKKNPVKLFVKFLMPRIIINFIKGILQKRNTSDVPEMSNETKNWLKEYYKEDVEKLSILLKRDLSKWAE